MVQRRQRERSLFEVLLPDGHKLWPDWLRTIDTLLDLLAHRIEVLKVSRDIDARTRESIDDTNRKHLLREQMRTIQKELGEGDEGAAEIAELDTAITEAKMPEEVEKQARKELKRLERMPEAAGEYSMVRTLTSMRVRFGSSLPFGKRKTKCSLSARAWFRVMASVSRASRR